MHFLKVHKKYMYFDLKYMHFLRLNPFTSKVQKKCKKNA